MELYKNSSASYQERARDLLSRMTLQEKVGQLCQSPMLDYQQNRHDYLDKVAQGVWGSRILADTAWAGNAPGESVDPRQLNEIQRAAVEGSRLGIPMIFARDVIYGQKTVLPIPLAQSCSWNPELVMEAYEGIAAEAASLGINWTFAPMLDIVRDPRWGRVIESSGEDPFLTSQFARAVVKGFQGEDPSQPNRLVACAKHFVGYGASEGGRDYDTTELSPNTLHNVHLPPFSAAVKAGVSTVMAGFNDLGGTPVTGSEALIRGWLKGEQKFDGMVISDWGSISDLAYFRVARDEYHAAVKALGAGVDMAMTNEAYEGILDQAIAEQSARMEWLDDAVYRVILTKFRAGLFENPYVDAEAHHEVLGKASHKQKALALAHESMVLLKNDGGILPLPRSGCRIAVIGPHAHSQRQHLGSWCLDGKASDVVSIAAGLRLAAPDNEILVDSDAFTDDMVECAHRADIVVLCVGESHRRTGEARNIAELELPPGQEAMIEAIGKTGKPLVIVQCTGRPVPSPKTEQYAKALVYAWQSGTEAGMAVGNLLFGHVNPSGKLTMTVPRSSGQIPMYYARKPLGKMRAYQEYSPYKNEADTPLYPFGFGLSYSQFDYRNLCCLTPMVQEGENIIVEIDIENLSDRGGQEVVQCYISRRTSSTTRPERELKAFAKCFLLGHETQTVRMVIAAQDLTFYGDRGCYQYEPGELTIYVGADSTAAEAVTVTLS
ncbi:glycoside hydrolase family 3 N-terminal domain-containing protein [Vibrio sp. CAU 1672]|uniref:glycoside hydrolase family 3 N-terminal domain-containing protein n=1 Tax=Vibrio sp. CAU 1672 TaxID=3032594 RepID=UPI0023D9D597|nr:glycoside hydrolase family 3 N-terminal domain-containing protein [Vibrio sp. CAU 1672]MDF2152789.1 glycoside hydrolase family 3 N-terminal domain-containing protein [Vibrio sp. CAU 1672]